MTRTTPDLDPSTAAALNAGRIAVNLLWCVPGEVGGSEEYLARQVLGLGQIAPDFQPTLYCPEGYVTAHPEMRRRFDVRASRHDGRHRARRIVTEHTWLAAQTRRADLVHHGGGTAPTVGKRPIVLTIHDLQYLRHPEYHGALKLRYLSWAIPRAVRRADVVTVPTEWVRSSVVATFDIDPADVLVVRHGVDPALGADAPTSTELRRRYGLGDGPVVVYPAITHPHKGHLLLLEAMAAGWTDPDLRLVLLGGRGAADAAVEAAIIERGLGGRVVRPGRVPAADRDGLVALSSALVFPSEYEGFGAPVVEAMTLGTPVVCADHPALVEVAGPAAIVLPRSVEAWAGALVEVARRCDELVAAGRVRAAAFTSACAGADLAVAYRRALGSA
jgi:alpha-1,3-rhamnosyl/mannosyltransferase